MRALIALTQPECKRIIAKGIAEHPLVHETLKEGKIFVARGSTNAYIIEELAKNSIAKNHYVAGQMTGDKELFRFGSLNADKRLPEMVFDQGMLKNVTDSEIEIKNLGPNDLIFKGANALGSDWIAGVYIAHPESGTIGLIVPSAIAKGIPIMVPMSLIKYIPESVWDLSQMMGNKTFDKDYVMGNPIGLMAIPGEAFTELEAFDILFPEVDVYVIGAGGVGRAEGSVHFLLEGDEEEVKEAYHTIQEIVKNEKDYNPDLD